MQSLITFILASAGLSWVITKSILFRTYRERISRKKKDYPGKSFEYMTRAALTLENLPPIKKPFIPYRLLWLYDELLNCSGCMGFWAGLIMYPVFFSFLWVKLLPYGFVAAISTLIIVRLSEFLRK